LLFLQSIWSGDIEIKEYTNLTKQHYCQTDSLTDWEVDENKIDFVLKSYTLVY